LLHSPHWKEGEKGGVTQALHCSLTARTASRGLVRMTPLSGRHSRSHTPVHSQQLLLTLPLLLLLPPPIPSPPPPPLLPSSPSQTSSLRPSRALPTLLGAMQAVSCSKCVIPAAWAALWRSLLSWSTMSRLLLREQGRYSIALHVHTTDVILNALRRPALALAQVQEQGYPLGPQHDAEVQDVDAFPRPDASHEYSGGGREEEAQEGRRRKHPSLDSTIACATRESKGEPRIFIAGRSPQLEELLTRSLTCPVPIINLETGTGYHTHGK